MSGSSLVLIEQKPTFGRAGSRATRNQLQFVIVFALFKRRVIKVSSVKGQNRTMVKNLAVHQTAGFKSDLSFDAAHFNLR